MGRRRKTGDRPYRFWERKDRPIAVQFDHIPGKWISTGCYDMPGAIAFAEDRLDHDGVDKSSIPSLRDFARDFFSNISFFISFSCAFKAAIFSGVSYPGSVIAITFG